MLRRLLALLVGAGVTAIVAGCGSHGHHAASAHARRSPPVSLGGGSAAQPSAGRDLYRRIVLGRSARGRPIRAEELGDPRQPVALLAVGVVHGNEPAGLAVVRRLEAHPPAGAHVWVIDDLNPDGLAAGTRVNAQGVDLNRNFPYRWRPLSVASGQYSGPGPLSAPEARIAERLILRVRPRVAVWFHQPLGVIDLSGGDPRVERRFARLAGMRTARLTRYPGSAVGWQDHRLPGTTAFVAELPAGRLPAALAARLASALRALCR